MKYFKKKWKYFKKLKIFEKVENIRKNWKYPKKLKIFDQVENIWQSWKYSKKIKYSKKLKIFENVENILESWQYLKKLKIFEKVQNVWKISKIWKYQGKFKMIEVDKIFLFMFFKRILFCIFSGHSFFFGTVTRRFFCPHYSQLTNHDARIVLLVIKGK